MSRRVRERGVTIVETAVYVAILGGLMLSFVGGISTAAKAEREALTGAEARLEADRLYEMLARELGSASLATVRLPAPGGAASELAFRRVTGVETDAATGLPVAVIEADEVDWAAEPRGLVRAQAGGEALISTRLAELRAERLGDGRAFRLRIVAEVRTGDRDPATGTPAVARAVAEGTVLVASD